MALFPLGVTHYLIGGVLVGIGVSLIFLLTGIYSGASSFFGATISWFVKSSRLQKYDGARSWRIWLTIGILGGAALYAITTGNYFVTQVQWWRLAVGGLLVGVGARMAGGCTSGHGICGMASLHKSSFASVALFLIVGISVALLMSSLGVTP
jgi:uncharacterized membrane protein YedE/YeeE